jgi:hypothetical protein
MEGGNRPTYRSGGGGTECSAPLQDLCISLLVPTISHLPRSWLLQCLLKCWNTFVSHSTLHNLGIFYQVLGEVFFWHILQTNIVSAVYFRLYSVDGRYLVNDDLERIWKDIVVA